MGTKMAPSFANLFMGNLEKEFLSRQILKPQIWLRFIDDIFMIWPHGEDSLKIFVENINSFHSTIKFTADSSRVSVHFLDTTVTIENGSLKTDLFNKPTDKHNYLLPSSCHPPHCTKNIPYSQALRIKRLPQLLLFPAPQIYGTFLVRAKFQDKTSVEANNENFGCSPCPSNCKTCALIDSTKYFQSYQTARTFQIRQSINCLSKNVIYLIYCNLCGTQYVGESKNSLRMRMTQHRSAIKTKKN
ncbi:hypothetical protein HOLleu_44904 [Holothuria leucospilota]|uniref:GIY-YIG domain-containing protein n=1 Tax=Holothuria leucospilota TaxID=206669 RepID=A0A9Q1B8I5_HOLLE|nr:hypothetical protein HOLleu_44904 [Holothuria leucospilota]